ncbi:RING-H2 finger protein ATL63 [Gossypium australe]|uniref:RING-H2 finger protein ATL63 n=1 Tax=Gossypium australe TaxID=47621 RepID=A0A5B6WGC5_9ROSI|nr:RING-H2 finger protein ATL63 [Gossypium australe]
MKTTQKIYHHHSYPQTPPMAHNGRTLRDYVLPNLEMVQGSITRPTIIANNFEIKSAMIQMIQNNLQFRGTIRKNQDPSQHGMNLQENFYKNRPTKERDRNIQTVRMREFSRSL